MGRDHKALLKLNIFKCLREGDNSRKHPIKQAWGKRTGLKDWEVDTEPSNLYFIILETFENLFMNIVGRIVSSDLGQNF